MKNEFETRDLYLTAFLLLNQYKLVSTKANEGVVYFTFEYSPEIKNWVLKYFSQNTSVEPLRFLDTIRSLKHLIQDTLR